MTVYVGKTTILQVTISASLTTITGIRNVDFDPGENSVAEIDDLSSDYVDLMPTGSGGGGTVTGELLWDPTNAQAQALHILQNTPAIEAWSITWSTTAQSQLFNGILTKMPISANRTDPLTSALEIKISDRPTLNES